jgi:RNA polymerase sigma factor (sigma-70 family)
MAITQSDFAVALRKLRPGLVQAARRLRRCNYDDADDLVSEVVLSALARLPEYTGGTGVNGLRRWLTGILHRAAQRDYREETFQIATEPLSEAEGLPAVDDAVDTSAFEDSIHTLPRTHRRLVFDWLDGYGQDAIARRNRLHRNTVAIRLEESFAILRLAFPDAETLTTTYALFAFCSRATVYRKPKSPWFPWLQQHPPERPFRRTVRRKEEEDPAAV